MNFLFSKENVCEKANLKVVASDTAKVFYNDSRDFFGLYPCNEFVPRRTVKGSTRPTIVRIMPQIHKAMFFGVGFQHLLLIDDAVAVAISIIVTRKAFI